MLTGTVKAAFYSARADLYEPACVVDRVANGIRSFGHHHFITLICARVRDGSLDFVNAGHPPGILLNGAIAVALLESTGRIISPGFNSSWEQQTIRSSVEYDRIAFLRTPDRSRRGSEQYGLDRRLNKPKVPWTARLCRNTFWEGPRFMADRLIDDDLTLVIADL